MGYGDNPYLIYAHRDTENNHVHIVSSRVDKKGKKISDTFENLRSQEFLQQHLNVSYASDYEKCKAEVLQYAFSNINQFKLLFERRGFELSEKSDGLYIFKGGLKIDKLDTDLNTLFKSNSNQAVVNKHKAILNKYAKGKSLEQVESIMREKFGVELVFHFGKNNTESKTPYGYTFIDHKNKIVFKGSEILKLSYLLQARNAQYEHQTIYDTIDRLIAKNYGLKKIAKELDQMGYKIENDKIILKETNKLLTKLNYRQLEALKYKDRLSWVKQFEISDQRILPILAKVFLVKQNDLNNNVREPNKDLYINLIQASLLFNNETLSDCLKKRNSKLFFYKNDFLLVDYNNKVALGIDDNLAKSIGLNSSHALNIEKNLKREYTPEIQQSEQQGIFNFLDFLDLLYYQENDQDINYKSKRKRKL